MSKRMRLSDNDSVYETRPCGTCTTEYDENRMRERKERDKSTQGVNPMGESTKHFQVGKVNFSEREARIALGEAGNARYRSPQTDDEVNDLVGHIQNDVWNSAIRQYLGDSMEAGEDDTGCPCYDKECACKGYARHPAHRFTSAMTCFDDLCTAHGHAKVDLGIEPRRLRWMKKPAWNGGV